MSLKLDFFIKEIYLDINNSGWKKVENAERLLMINKLDSLVLNGKKIKARTLLIMGKDNKDGSSSILYDIKFKNNPFAENSGNFYKDGDYGVVVLKAFSGDIIKVKALMLEFENW